MSPRQILWIVFGSIWLLLNIVTFCVFGVDKRRARKDKWRVSEGLLFLLAICGGSAGAYMGMQVFHHKTRKRRFSIGIPLIFLLQAALAISVWFVHRS